MNSILIAGCGDLGLRVAEPLADQGAKVVGIRRSPIESASVEICTASSLVGATTSARGVSGGLVRGRLRIWANIVNR